MQAHTWRAAHQSRIWSSSPVCRNIRYARFIATDSRNRLSKFWTPTGGISPQDGEQDDSHALLLRGGFLRQAHSGVFHLLPLGLRVQNKLEFLIDKHMHSISASKTSLSSISTEALWHQSGRYSSNSELLRINDRRESGFLLSPTHEEEVTALVGSMVHSYKDLPLRLYQIGRKYRDERRPRQGLLRAREFMMKDLYTFDHSSTNALQTYEAVRAAYTNIFNDLKLPYLVADADSGNMGGKLSHEYHFISPKGEDNVWSCSSCHYVANEELVEKKPALWNPTARTTPLIFTGISTDHKTWIEIIVPNQQNIEKSDKEWWGRVGEFVNLHAVKRAVQQQHPGMELDTGIEASTLDDLSLKTNLNSKVQVWDRSLFEEPSSTHLDLTVTRPGAGCPKCEAGKLDVQKAIEVAHTFHLGTRYSEPLNALIALADGKTRIPMQMGCHGIGVSRLIGAVASLLADERGLNWPRAMAPYEAVIMRTPEVQEQDAVDIYSMLDGTSEVDVILDDREGKSLGWKLKDADLIGYPVIVVLGRGWKEKKEAEVQCRRLRVKKSVGFDALKGEVLGMLSQL